MRLARHDLYDEKKEMLLAVRVVANFYCLHAVHHALSSGSWKSRQRCKDVGRVVKELVSLVGKNVSARARSGLQNFQTRFLWRSRRRVSLNVQAARVRMVCRYPVILEVRRQGSFVQSQHRGHSD